MNWDSPIIMSLIVLPFLRPLQYIPVLGLQNHNYQCQTMPEHPLNRMIFHIWEPALVTGQRKAVVASRWQNWLFLPNHAAAKSEQAFATVGDDDDDDESKCYHFCSLRQTLNEFITANPQRPRNGIHQVRGELYIKYGPLDNVG